MIYKVTTNSATIKKQPLYSAHILDRLEINTEIEVLEISNKWATIIYKGSKAYISTMYIKAVEESIEIVDTPDNKVDTPTITDTIEEVSIPSEKESQVDEPIDSVNAEVTEIVDTTKEIEREDPTISKDIKAVSYFKSHSEYKSIKGTVTIKYIDYDDKVEMNPDRVYYDLDLNTYVFGAKAIKGYFNLGAAYEEITLSESENEKTITFYYKKRLGSVTVRYIDILTRREVETCEVFKNLAFDEYIYEAKEIEGYTVVCENSKIVSIDDTLTNCELYFEYELSKDN